MPITLGSSISSLRVKRQLNLASEINYNFTQQLSSGQRINRASDDAAGLAISDSLRTSTRITTQAIRNLNDGLSLFAIADATAGELVSILQRQSELSEQAANEVYSSVQRQALNQEAVALTNEYNRIISIVSFNNISIFDQLAKGISLQAGVGDEAILSIKQGRPLALTNEDNVIRVNMSSSGSEASGGLFSINAPQISSNGQFIVFASASDNLVADDNNNQQDIFYKDLITGNIIRVNTTSSGVESIGGDSFEPQISADGRYILYQSRATNISPGDTNNRQDIFAKDLLTGQTEFLSTSTGGGLVNNDSFNGQFSIDNTLLVFQSSASDLVAGDTNGEQDIFIKDFNNVTIRISTTDTGNEAFGGVSSGPQISNDKRFVVFESSANNLVTGDTNGLQDIFVKDLVTDSVSRINTTSSGQQAVGGSSQAPQFSADGRYIVFSSAATNLVANDTNGNIDIFVKDLVTGNITRVNTDSNGLEVTGGNSDAPQISADGRFVIFESRATDLVDDDNNNESDIFIKDLSNGEIRRLNVANDGSEAIGGGSFLPQISGDNKYIIFDSYASNLVANDNNNVNDVFRVLNPFYSSNESSLTPLSGIDLTTSGFAKNSLDTVNQYLTQVAQFRGEIGAFQVRINTAISNLEIKRVSESAAQALILNADVASVSSKVVASTIRQQTAASILSQASQQPEIALQLLQN